jgi:transcriptional regulator with XRE-family HTH domain
MDTAAIMTELATRLRVERARLNWTLMDAGLRSGVHYVSISRYENAVKLPTLDALYKLASAYGVEASSLLPPNAMGGVVKSASKKAKKK